MIFDLNRVVFGALFFKNRWAIVADNEEFKEKFNWWYMLGIVLALVAFPLLHILSGWYVFFFSN